MHPSPMDGDACPILVICVSFVILVNTVILVILANIVRFVTPVRRLRLPRRFAPRNDRGGAESQPLVFCLSAMRHALCPMLSAISAKC